MRQTHPDGLPEGGGGLLPVTVISQLYLPAICVLAVPPKSQENIGVVYLLLSGSKANVSELSHLYQYVLTGSS